MSGWKTKTAGILGGVYGLIGIAIHYIGGATAPGALDITTAIPLIIGGLAVFGVADKLQKLIDAIKALLAK
jgi:hypothetical protein